MRGEYDLYQSKYDAEGEHLEFKRHCRPNADCEADTSVRPYSNLLLHQRSDRQRRSCTTVEDVLGFG